MCVHLSGQRSNCSVSKCPVVSNDLPAKCCEIHSFNHKGFSNNSCAESIYSVGRNDRDSLFCGYRVYRNCSTHCWFGYLGVLNLYALDVGRKECQYMTNPWTGVHHTANWKVANNQIQVVRLFVKNAPGFQDLSEEPCSVTETFTCLLDLISIKNPYSDCPAFVFSLADVSYYLEKMLHFLQVIITFTTDRNTKCPSCCPHKCQTTAVRLGRDNHPITTPCDLLLQSVVNGLTTVGKKNIPLSPVIHYFCH